HPRRSVSHLITHLLPRHTAPVALLRTNHSFNYPCYFFFNDTATTEIYTLSLHDALPIWWCCWARRVVGARIATCLPAWTALKVARIATSVLPNPTSPNTRRSITASLSMSALTSWMAVSWSAVSSNGNAASISCCPGGSVGKANPSARARRRWRSTTCSATAAAALRTLARCSDQSRPPILDTRGVSPPVYLVTAASWSVGTYSRSSP